MPTMRTVLMGGFHGFLQHHVLLDQVVSGVWEGVPKEDISQTGLPYHEVFLMFQSTRVHTARIYKEETSPVTLMMQVPCTTGRQRAVGAAGASLSFSPTHQEASLCHIKRRSETPPPPPNFTRMSLDLM